MALLQISEPGKSTMPHEHRRVIGIDLGTTNSLVASVISGSPTILNIDNKSNLLPRSEERRVGKECRSRWWRYH